MKRHIEVVMIASVLLLGAAPRRNTSQAKWTL